MVEQLEHQRALARRGHLGRLGSLSVPPIIINVSHEMIMVCVVRLAGLAPSAAQPHSCAIIDRIPQGVFRYVVP